MRIILRKFEGYDFDIQFGVKIIYYFYAINNFCILHKQQIECSLINFSNFGCSVHCAISQQEFFIRGVIQES